MKLFEWSSLNKPRLIINIFLIVNVFITFYSIYTDKNQNSQSSSYLRETDDIKDIFNEATINLLYEQLQLAAVEHSITILDTVIMETSARVDILLLTSDEEIGEIEDRIHVFILHDGSQVQQVFREPSPEFYKFASQVSPDLLPPERLSFWQNLWHSEQQTDLASPSSVAANLYKLPFTGNTQHTVNQNFDKHFDFAGDGWLVRAAFGGVATNGIDQNGGYYTRVLHADGTYGWYIHFQAESWVIGTDGSTYNVAQGDCLAYTGSTGLAYGPHLHFNVSTTSNNAAGCDINTGCNPPYWLAVEFVEGAIPTNGANTPLSQNSTTACSSNIGGCCGCSATTQTPVYNTAFLTDAELTAYNSMSAQDVRDFLTANGSYFKSPVADVDGVTLDMANVIAQAATTYQISPKVLLTTLQKESSGVTRTTRPTDITMKLLMGCGSASTARAQIECSASYFRNYQNSLLNNGQTISGWQLGTAKQTVDGISVTPATNAVAGQFTYTPYAGSDWGGTNGGVQLFYQIWHDFGFASASSSSVNFSLIDLLGQETVANSAKEDLAPEWVSTVDPVVITSNNEILHTLAWPEAVDREGDNLQYLVYWGTDPEGTAETSTTSLQSYSPSLVDFNADRPAIYYLRVAARDESGNISDWQTVNIWQYDPVPPTGFLMVGSGGDIVNRLAIDLTMSAEDEGSQLSLMRFSSDGKIWSEWEPYSERKGWQLEESGQLQTVYAQVQDAAGNISDNMEVSVTAELALAPPTSTNYILSCSTFGMGGGQKSSTSFTVISTTGQTYETGWMRSSSYWVNSGYWAACGGSGTTPPENDNAFKVFLPTVLK